MPRALIVSHPNVVTHNQLVYLRLAERGWELELVVPDRWKDEYTPGGFVPQPLAGLEGSFERVRVALAGRPQRHFYLASARTRLRRARPDVLFLEQEPFSIPALQWGWAAQRLGVPWGLQADENLDRPFPWPARAIRRWCMPRVDFYASRSPGASRMLERWGARGAIAVVPHTIPEWPASEREAHERFTVGFAGRLVAEKGIDDLLAAVRALPFASRLLLVGDGPLRDRVAGAELGRGTLELRTGVRSPELRELYREMDVLVLASRTTSTWAEQFGKVLCEALLCGTPVVGASSGEIPWVIETTGGGVVFPEGDPAALARELERLHAEPAERARLAARGLDGVWRHFAPGVAAAGLDGLMRAALDRGPR